MPTPTPPQPTSRRYGSRFKVAFQRVLVPTVTIRSHQGLESSLTAKTALPIIGIPPSGYYTYQAVYNAGWGVQFFNTANHLTSTNGLGIYPTTAVDWDDSTWSRVPHLITWYDDDDTPRLRGTTTGYYYSLSATREYRMYLSWWHTVAVVNNSNHDITVHTRSFSRHTWLSKEFGDLVLTPWAPVLIPAKETVQISGFQPLEIKITSDSSAQDYFGYTTQQGEKILLYK